MRIFLIFHGPLLQATKETCLRYPERQKYSCNEGQVPLHEGYRMDEVVYPIRV